MADDDSKDRKALKIVKKKAPGTFAIFEIKGFYRCYCDDAHIVAEQLLMSNVGIQHMKIDAEDVAYHNLNNSQYIRAVRDLLLFLRFRVELYEENATTGTYSLKAKGVLGNLVDFEDIVSECVELAELSTVGCLRLLEDDLTQENKMAMVFCNSQDLRIITAELNDTANFTLFEQCVVSTQPRECFLLKENSKKAPNRFKKLEMAIKRTGIVKSIIEEGEEQQENIEVYKEAVRKMLHPKFIGLEFSPVIWRTLHTLLAHMQLLNDPQYEGAFFVMQYGAAGHMYLSNAVMQALDIFAVDADTDTPIISSISSSTSSAVTLFEHLNRCRSAAGKRMIRDWIRRPLFSLRQIEERLDVVEAFCSCASARQSLHEDLLRRVPDIAMLTRKLVQRKATLQDCYRVYLLILLLRKIEFILRGMEEEIGEKLWASVKELIVEQFQHSRVEFERFVTLIERTLDLAYFEESGQHRIKPEIDEQLAEIAKQMAELDEKAQKVLEKFAKRMDCEVKLESNSEAGFFFRITLKSEFNLRSISDAKIIDSSKGGGIRFHTKQLEQLNDEYKELRQSYESSQAELTKLVIETCAGYAPALHSLAERIAVLDVLTAFSVVAASSPSSYVRPKILEKGSGVLDLRQCRHPVVEHLPGIQFIPNDLRIGPDADCGKFMILTGANMGGKSTYLKAAALTLLMGQMGCFVPCESAIFSMVDGIYTRVGAGDFQCKGISTFMAEMVDCATLLEKATSNSLILIDELGRGTSTYDGFGMAWAIAEDIIERVDCFCLFATHFHEIAKLEEKHPGKAKNYRMDTLLADGNLTILYQVVPGVTDKSFGVNIAEMVGFPKEILEEAEGILNQLETGNVPQTDEKENEKMEWR